jgi:hypothetical protein
MLVDDDDDAGNNARVLHEFSRNTTGEIEKYYSDVRGVLVLQYLYHDVDVIIVLGRDFEQVVCGRGHEGTLVLRHLLAEC